MKNIVTFYDKATINQEADAWLIKLDRDEDLNRQEQDELHQWMARSPQHREELHEMAKLWGNMNVLTELSVPLRRPAWYQSVLDIPRQTLATAASGVVALAVVIALILMPGAIDKTNGRYITDIGQQTSYTLADGSVVQLNTNSQLRVEYGEQYRDIYLEQGEAHFDVAKNKAIPFRVFAGNGRVQAIGTAFAVHLKTERAVQVTVTEGRVALAGLKEAPIENIPSVSADQAVSNSKPKSLAQYQDPLGTLAAGQGATISSVDNPVEPVLKDIQIYKQEELSKQMAWRKGVLVFTGEPLEQVVKEISRYTDVVIDIPDADVRAIKVGGQFEVGDTQMMLSALETTFSLLVERDAKGQVTILSRD